MSEKPAAETLRALSENKTDGITKTTTFRVDPNLITFEPGFNLRTDGDELDLHVDRLYNAMKAGAFIPSVDVQVKDGKVIARDGHCRTKAAQRIKLEMPDFTLECRQLRGNDADAILHMLGTGSGAKPLTPLEQGKGILRLINMGLNPIEIANKLGVSRVTVDNNLSLAEAPQEVQQAISNGEVSSTVARDALKGGVEGVAALMEEVKKERENPTPTPKKKGGKTAKKKVTAKKLKNTAAAKKTPKKKAAGELATPPADGVYVDASGKVAAPTLPVPVTNVLDLKDDEILLCVNKDVAKATAEFLRGFGGEDVKLKEMATLLETELM